MARKRDAGDAEMEGVGVLAIAGLGRFASTVNESWYSSVVGVAVVRRKWEMRWLPHHCHPPKAMLDECEIWAIVASVHSSD